MDNNIPCDFPADDGTEELDPRDIYRPIPKSSELEFPDWELYSELPCIDHEPASVKEQNH